MANVAGEILSALQIRLEQQRHWELADSVRDGEQPSIDPDSHRLIELRTGVRLYRGDAGTFVKRLVDGSWRLEAGVSDVIQ